jgi:hypothetical protein
MLRVGFLPSDFNPMILVLGEAEDLHCLAGVLRQFARGGEPVPLHELPFCAAATPVTLRRAAGPQGVQRADAPPGPLLWCVSQERAAAFAGQVESLAQPARIAGSELLLCGGQDEVPVKVSRGEYTDDFLLGPAES